MNYKSSLFHTHKNDIGWYDDDISFILLKINFDKNNYYQIFYDVWIKINRIKKEYKIFPAYYPF